MNQHIALAAILAREGRMLCIRRPGSRWELPGGSFAEGSEDIDQAMDDILRDLGVRAPSVEDDFLQTAYVPHPGGGQTVLNIYAPSGWDGEPRAGDGEEMAWFGIEDFETLDMERSVKNAVLSIFGFGTDEEDSLLLEFQSDLEGFVDAPGFQVPLRDLARLEASFSVDEFPRESLAPPQAEPDDEIEALSLLEAMEELGELDVQTGGDERFSSPASPARGQRSAALRPDAPETAPLSPGSPRREAGLDVLRTLSGAADPTAAVKRMASMQPEIAGDVVDFALGEVWSHPALDRRTRSLQVVAMLSALGGRQGPLRSHIHGALNHGATPDQVIQTLRMVAVYAGFPAALEAWPVMEEVFASRGIARPGKQT